MSREDSSGFWKSVSALPCLPSARARAYLCRMNNPHRVVVVTGASQGIGAGLVAGYRRLSFGVVATSRSIAPSKDEQVLAIPGDIRDRATAQKVVEGRCRVRHYIDRARSLDDDQPTERSDQWTHGF